MAGLGQRSLAPVLDRLDGRWRASARGPTPREDGTRHPASAWDLRTFIAVPPAGGPFRFLNLNLTLGRTGTAFDREPPMDGAEPGDTLDLQLCFEGLDGAVTEKRLGSVRRDLVYTPGAVALRLGERVEIRGGWPSTRVRYRQPEAGLELEMTIEAWPGLAWWTRLRGAYCHYTSFGTARLEWRRGAATGQLELPVLHDHGWGRRMPNLGAPLRRFRYEVLRLPGEGHLLALHTEGPGGVELRSASILRRGADEPTLAGGYTREVLEWETFDNHAGRPCRVPRRWRGRRTDGTGELHYEAVRVTEPRAVLGDGFLYAFDYELEMVGGDAPAGSGRIEGRGYAEQLGVAWAAHP
jgi:hypothetical protein